MMTRGGDNGTRTRTRIRMTTVTMRQVTKMMRMMTITRNKDDELASD